MYEWSMMLDNCLLAEVSYNFAPIVGNKLCYNGVVFRVTDVIFIIVPGREIIPLLVYLERLKDSPLY